MFLRNVSSQFFIVKYFSKSLLLRNLYVATFINRYSESVVLLHSKQKLSVCSIATMINEMHLKTEHFRVTKIALNCVIEVTCVTNQSLTMTSI